MLGYKYKISNLQAAIGCAQLERIEELIARKRDVFQYYADELLSLTGVTMNPEGSDTVNGYWMPTVVFAPESGIRREGMQEAFAKRAIDARVFFWPLSSLPMFKPKPENKNSYDIPTRAINLPSYHDLTYPEMSVVCEVVKTCLQERS
jgi:perosamine synthetase